MTTYLNCSTCSNICSPMHIFTFVFLSLTIHITFVIFTLIFIPNLCVTVQIIHELLQPFLTVGYHCFVICISDGIDHSASDWYAMSAFSMASLIIVSSYNTYSRGDREHPCITVPNEHALEAISNSHSHFPSSLPNLPNQMPFHNAHNTNKKMQTRNAWQSLAGHGSFAPSEYLWKTLITLVPNEYPIANTGELSVVTISDSGRTASFA